MKRPEEIDVTAMDEKGEAVAFRCGGLLARAIQHEWDHLQGILFIDRMDGLVRADLKPEIDAIQAETKKALGNPLLPPKTCSLSTVGQASRGFTLIELLVVIAIIAILAGLLTAVALARTKQKALGISA